MSGSRTKKLRKETAEAWTKEYRRLGKRMKPFKNVFRIIKRAWNVGEINA